MGMLKINTLHFHLTDDNGWRGENKKYPRPAEGGDRGGGRYGVRHRFKACDEF